MKMKITIFLLLIIFIITLNININAYNQKYYFLPEVIKSENEILSNIIQEAHQEKFLSNDLWTTTRLNIDSNIVTFNDKFINASNKGDLELVKQLFDKNIDIDYQCKENGNTALILASKNGHIDVVEYLLSQGADINRVNNLSYPAIWYAANEGHFTIVDLLLEYNVNINKTYGGTTLLQWNAYQGNLANVKSLIDRGAEINIITNTRGGALRDLMSVEITSERKEILRILFQNGAVVYNSWLDIAEENGYLEYIKELLKIEVNKANNYMIYYGLVLDYPDEEWIPLPIKFMIEIDSVEEKVNGSYNIFHSNNEKYISDGVLYDDYIKLENEEKIYLTWDINDEVEGDIYPKRFFGYIEKENREFRFEVKRERIIGDRIEPIEDDYISQKEMIIFPDLIFTSSIDLGAGSWSPITIEYTNNLPVWELINIGESIRGRQPGSIRFVHHRSYNYYFTMASFAPEYLRNYRNTENTLNYLKRWSVKSLYTYNLYNKFITELKESEKNVYNYYIDVHGLSSEEARDATDRVISRIIDRAAGSYPGSSTYPENFSYDYISPLFEAIINNADLYLIEKLLKEENDPEYKIEALKAGMLYNRSIEVVEMIARDIVYNDEMILSTSTISCSLGSLEMLELLIELGINIDQENVFAKTPLYYAIQYSYFDAVKLLVENGANVNHEYGYSEEYLEYLFWERERVTQKRTPLMHAAQHSNVEMMEYLVEMGADLYAVDEYGSNVLDYANRKGKSNNIEFLELKLSE
ncbi:ankyrin repeat domain-containing protein [Natronospora cellulosivora (SeqCode)]